MKALLTKGQLPIGLLLTFGGAVAGSTIWIYSLTADAQSNVSAVSERTARLEVTTQNTDKSITEIKEDLKDIKRALNVKE